MVKDQIRAEQAGWVIRRAKDGSWYAMDANNTPQWLEEQGPKERGNCVTPDMAWASACSQIDQAIRRKAEHDARPSGAGNSDGFAAGLATGVAIGLFDGS